MKLVSYLKEGHEQLAMLVDDMLYDTDGLHPELPSTMGMFLTYWDDYVPLCRNIFDSITAGKIYQRSSYAGRQVGLELSFKPIPAGSAGLSGCAG